MYNLSYDFSKVSNEKEAYILGYLYADGYVMGFPHYRLGISLSKKDLKILEEIRDYICKDIPLKFEDRGTEGIATLTVSRKIVFKNLKKLGLKPNKTGLEFGIPKIKKKLVRHFIRGYLDGDGSVIRDRGYYRVSIVSPTKTIVEEIAKELIKEGIHALINRDNRKGTMGGYGINKYNQYRVLVNKKIYLDILYHYLYDGATIFLDRKHSVLKECLETKFEKTSNNIEYLKYGNNTKTLKEWALVLGISERDLSWRLSKYDTSIALNPDFMEESYKRRIYYKGDDHPCSLLSNKEVVDIFLSVETGSKLGIKYNVHSSTIDKIRTRVNYSSVTKDLVRPTKP